MYPNLNCFSCVTSENKDTEISKLIDEELNRQNKNIELIASENYPSKAILDACGSIAICKYAEGYPEKRYYGGCEYIDKIEQLAIDRMCSLFKCKYANVQPHCGSNANFAAYRALLPNGGTILSMDLNSGGHLTHGSPVSFSSNMYHFEFYPLDKTGHIDFVRLEQLIIATQPDVVLCGGSAYPYVIDFDKFREIINRVKPNTYLMADIAHIAGLIAAEEHPSPFPACDVVTTTTHKTLRGPRGGAIMWNKEDLTKPINSAVFPFTQGGPLENIIAGKAIMAFEAAKPKFKEYIKQVKENTKTIQSTLKGLGCTVSDTDNHLFLLNTMCSFGITGLEAQKRLEEIGITTNKNMIPGDTLSPAKTSGLRIGCAAITTRGATTSDCVFIAFIIYSYLMNNINKEEATNFVHRLTDNWKSIDSLGE